MWRLLVHVVEINISDMQVGSLVSCIICDHCISSNDLKAGKTVYIVVVIVVIIIIIIIIRSCFGDVCSNWSNLELFWKNGVVKEVQQQWPFMAVL